MYNRSSEKYGSIDLKIQLISVAFMVPYFFVALLSKDYHYFFIKIVIFIFLELSCFLPFLLRIVKYCKKHFLDFKFAVYIAVFSNAIFLPYIAISQAFLLVFISVICNLIVIIFFVKNYLSIPEDIR